MTILEALRRKADLRLAALDREKDLMSQGATSLASLEQAEIDYLDAEIDCLRESQKV